MNWFRSLVSKFSNRPKEEQDYDKKENSKSSRTVDPEFLLELEEILLKRDCGIGFSELVINKIRNQKISTDQAFKIIKNIALETLEENQKVLETRPELKKNKTKLKVILIVGVNGVGKTTSIGKLAYKLRDSEQSRVLIAPCDTFRAAATEQVKIWSDRSGATIYPKSKTNQRPDTVLYESLKYARENQFDVLLIDTAGRLQNKEELMNELLKTKKVLDKHCSPTNTLVEKLLILDANTGQNAIHQAKMFHTCIKLEGIILTKLDSTAKGGIVFTIAQDLKIPIKYIGVGEKIQDLKNFSSQKFVKGLIE